MLRPGGRNEIRSLGPSFFTKFLYVGLYLGTAPLKS
jgi:hypothetical protein